MNGSLELGQDLLAKMTSYARSSIMYHTIFLEVRSHSKSIYHGLLCMEFVWKATWTSTFLFSVERYDKFGKWWQQHSRRIDADVGIGTTEVRSGVVIAWCLHLSHLFYSRFDGTYLSIYIAALLMCTDYDRWWQRVWSAKRRTFCSVWWKHHTFSLDATQFLPKKRQMRNSELCKMR